jgi:hypothetical protein
MAYIVMGGVIGGRIAGELSSAAVNKQKINRRGRLLALSCSKINLPIYGTWQLGKKVLDTILAVCPRVALLLGLKYGRLEPMHGSPAPPHSYPLMMAREVSRWIHW